MSWGASQTTIEACVDMDQVCDRYPEVAPLYCAFRDHVASIPGLAEALGDQKLGAAQDNERIQSEFHFHSPSLNEEEYEAAFATYFETWGALWSKLHEVSGLELGLTYAPRAEDSYAMRREELVYFIWNAYEPRRFTPEMESSGLEVEDVDWRTYG